MIIGYHYHIPGIRKNGKYLTSSQQGIFIDGLAPHAEKIICYLHSPNDDELITMDYVIKNENVEIVSIGTHDSIYKRTLFPYKYTSKIISKDFDILFLRGPSPLLPILLLKYNKIPIALLIVGDYVRIDVLKKKINIKNILIFLWSKFNKNMQDYLIRDHLLLLNNQWLYKEYFDKNKNIGLVSTSLISKSHFYKKIDTCNNKIINILYVGRIDREKGIVDIAKAIIILLEKGKNVRLDIAGHEEKGDEIIKQVLGLFKKQNKQTKIKYHGHVTFGKELLKLYRNADIFVTASKSTEGFPRTFWESFSQCLPVITTNVGGIGHTINDKKHALFCEPRSHKSIASKIEELINNQGLRKTIIKNSYQLALNNSFELNSKKIFNYLKNHLESNKKKIDYDTL